jgi:cell wall-associated NlpC family hydrolase
MDVATSARLFYTRLLAVPGWQTMTVNDAAQTAQGSATPDVYARWEGLATQLAAGVQAACTTLPPVAATGAALTAITAAEQALGTAYSFGGSCADPHSANMALHCDCSSLVKTAWAAAGIQLPRTSEQQYLAVHLIPGASPTNLTAVPAGALLFYEPGADGQPGLPGHVALYIGNGQLIEASQTGQPVAIRPVYASTWLGAGTVA